MTVDEIIQTIKVAKAEVEWHYPMNYYVAFDEAIAILKEKKRAYSKARWIESEVTIPKGTRTHIKNSSTIYKCSFCGATHGKYPTPYCPYCGAKMEG